MKMIIVTLKTFFFVFFLHLGDRLSRSGSSSSVNRYECCAWNC